MAKKTKQHPFLEAMDKYTLTREDFKDYFSKVMDFVKKLSEKNKAEFTNLNSKISDLGNEMRNNNEIDRTTIKEEIVKERNRSLKEQGDGLNFLRDKAMKIRDFTDGKDADEKKIVKRVLKKIVLPEFKETVLDTPIQVAEKLELLDGENRLKLESILGLNKRLEELESRPTVPTGAGVGKLALEARMIDDETPSEVPNDVITDFKLVNTPNPPTSVEVFADGQRMNLTEDYTISGRTVTFGTAPLTDTIIKFKYRI